MPERRSGRTTQRLEHVLAELRGGASVGFVVHELRFVPYCIGLLMGLGATASEADAIRFGSLTTFWNRYRGWRGRLSWDHLVDEMGTSEQLRGLYEMQAACDERRFVPLIPALTLWRRLMGEDAF